MKRITVLICALSLVFGLCSCKETTHHDSLDYYLKTDVPIIYNDLKIFPIKDELDESSVDIYQSSSVETLLFDDVYFLLRCNYSKQKYEQEVLRFKDLGAYHQHQLFRYPAYVMLFYDKFYEYALLDSANYSIIYVFAMTTDFLSSESLVTLDDFPKEYMPIASPEADIVVYNY